MLEHEDLAPGAENEPKEADGKVRLNRYLASCGYGSRRDCDEHIAHGRVMLNNELVKEFGVRIDPKVDIVAFDSVPVTGPLRFEYFAYHKARGSVTTAYDPEGRETIYDALRVVTGRDVSHLKYMGRLDRNSEGLLLLTNDGSLIHALTHPKYQIKKTYQVRIDRTLTIVNRQQMLGEGVVSEDQVLHAGAIRDLDRDSDVEENWYEIDLYEGKNRQIRRMFAELGYDVSRLKRIQFANIKLNDLPRGQLRALEEREIKGLKTKGYPEKSPPSPRRDVRPSGGGGFRGFGGGSKPRSASGGGNRRPPDNRSGGGNYHRPDGDRPGQGGYRRPDGDRPSQGGYRRPDGDRPSQGGTGGYRRPDGDRLSQGGYRRPDDNRPGQGGNGNYRRPDERPGNQ